MPRVAIVGGGPAGLAAARYLQHEGFEPIILERAAALGGQWSGDRRASGIWPSMHTNTSRVLTALGDRPHPPGTPVYPANQAIGAYLRRYAADFGLDRQAHLETEVESLGRAPGGWRLRTRGPGGSTEETFPYVVIAPGRYHRPALPDVAGLAGFSGPGGVTHTNAYEDAARHRGQRVLVAGCAISALEIASELAVAGAERVVTTNRRQRYVLPKLCGGVPTDHLAFSRAAGLAAELLPPDVVAASLKAFVLRWGGNPGQYGAPAPAEPLFAAGLTLAQHYLPLVAEGRITIQPWIDRVEGQRVTFGNGTSEVFDAIIFGTGYRLDLPFLDDELTATLDVDGQHLDLHRFTFHPDLPGLAFLGLFHQIGPLFPVLELQARWVAYTWSGALSAPSETEMRAGVAAARSRRPVPQLVPMHTTARAFAAAAGVDPDVAAWPALARALLFGPLSPSSFRLSGRDALPDAASRVEQDAAAFGAITSPGLTTEQCAQLQSLAAASRDLDFAALVGRLTAQS